MPNFNKKVFYAVIPTVAVAVGLVFFAGLKTERVNIDTLAESSFDISNIKPDSGENIVLPKTSQTIENALPVEKPVNQNKAEAESKDKIKVVIYIGGKNIEFFVPDGSTVYDAMVLLSASQTADFSFKAKAYPGIGYFIEEINGIKNTGGKYWTLYVNGKYATVGASDYKLLAGDKVEWEYK